MRGSAQPQQASSALATFWRPFVASQSDTAVVFGEVGRHNGKPLAGASRHGLYGMSFGYLATPGLSGVGEVAGVHALDGVFNSFHHSLRIKRGGLFTFDDAINENAIFLGSALSNPPVRLLQINRDFVFQVVQNDAGQSELAIVNNKPQPGEPKQFLATPASLPTKDDYAVIALFPGMSPGERILVLAGMANSEPRLREALCSSIPSPASSPI